MQGTLRRSFKPILSFSVVMGIAVIAFAQFAHLCFGAKVNLEVSLPYPIMGTLLFFFSFCSSYYLSLSTVLWLSWLMPIPTSAGRNFHVQFLFK